ncbi:MAG: glutamate synthase large subunit [Chloroflexota bacterium]|nr:glutamate synthase large subunit [Chloroflexota bacterium]
MENSVPLPKDQLPLAYPQTAGLYDPRYEHDACGVAFVADVKGRRSHDTVAQALQALENLLHRGATGSEANTGDGAGVLLQIPHNFLSRECSRLGFTLPDPGRYAVGMVFLPHDPCAARLCEEKLEEIARASGMTALGWRDVPRDNSPIGPSARAGEPLMRQVFLARPEALEDDLAFERALYLVRRRAENALRVADFPGHESFYVPSLSSKTVVYKGMLSADQISTYFPDLTDPAVESALCLVHQRFSTNTFPAWRLAHPYRMLAHNGEINTLGGNVNWMKARERHLASELFGDAIKDILPVTEEGQSDSATLDNVLELLVMSGRSLPHAVMMLIPEPWAGHEDMNELKRDFYDYHSSLMEPWDGPATVTFTDGTLIGAVLDRNGLRPSRYYVTKDDRVIFASEVGVLPIPPENVAHKGRLEPGRMLLIDTAEGRIVDDSEVKARTATEQPYGRWLAENRVHLCGLPEAPCVPEPDHETLLHRQQVFGFTEEEKRLLLGPMAQQGEEPIGSMGTDTPLAVLSERPQLLYNYFKQLFAQVTNPPLDAIREQLVTSVSGTLGPEGNLLDPRPESCRQIEIPSPVLDNDQLSRLRCNDLPGFRACTLRAVFDASKGPDGLAQAMEEIYRQADEYVASGCTILILSDRDVDADHAPIPSLLATAGLHHHLIREGTRTTVGFVVESGDAREVHHFCLLFGYGATAVNPYLAFETLDGMIRDGELEDLDHDTAVKQYVKAVNKGVLKVMSKMGISTLQSYHGAQIFEAVGLNREVVDRYFTGTASRIAGVGLDVIAQEALKRHRKAYPERVVPGGPELDMGSEYQWRRGGEYHLFNPQTVYKLQHATQTKQYKIFKEYTQLVDDQSHALSTIRGLLDLKYADEPVPLEEVEPVENILRRFMTGAMSFGSISKEAHEDLAIAMNRIGGRSNTGEGGEDPARYVREPNGDWKRSAVKQVASARFGVTSEYLVNADELQIKMAQGAKPGEGGQLPGHKVSGDIARVRHSTPGVGLISPPPHHDIYSIEDLAQLIYDLKNANSTARVSVKLVASVGVGTVAAGVSKAHSDVVLISGHDGGTGASPLNSLKHAGIPWELGLAETQQVLVMNNLRDRIIVQTDGQLKTGRDVVVAALLGAEEYGFATAPLVVMGCIMMRVCHLNTCPVGIATQDPELRKRYAGKPEFVENFFRFIAEEIREQMARLGFRTMDEMIGRVDRLDTRKAVDHWKARGLDLSTVLHHPQVSEGVATRRIQEQDHGLSAALDNQLIELARPALEQRLPVHADLPIHNVNRTVGTMLGAEVTWRYGGAGLPDGTISLKFNGSAGQTFGGWLPHGITLTLEGDANDYVGKGLSGGRIAVYPPAASTFAPEENVLIGNVALYGATSGEAFFNGVAGERFAVRNSGAHAVVEGVGDHGCEYMTGGRVVVLGRTGRNFAAGMSGGLAYVLDEDGAFERRCNKEMVDLETPDEGEDRESIHRLVQKHYEWTGSPWALRILENWERYYPLFIKVFPRDYRRVLEAQRTETADVMRVESEVAEARHAL